MLRRTTRASTFGPKRVYSLTTSFPFSLALVRFSQTAMSPLDATLVPARKDLKMQQHHHVSDWLNGRLEDMPAHRHEYLDKKT